MKGKDSLPATEWRSKG